MPDSKISELPPAAALQDTDVSPIVQGVGSGTETRRATFGQIRSIITADRPLYVRDFGAAGDGTTDDTLAIQTAMNNAAAAGGGVVTFGPRRYLVDSADLIIPPNVTLRGAADPGGFRVDNDYTSIPYAIVLNPLRTIRLRRNAALEGVAILRKGLVAPSNVREALDCVAAFSGTAVSVGDGTTGGSPTNATDASVRSLLIIGFTWGIYSNGSSRTRVLDVVGDCTNGLYLGRSYDIAHNERINWHPLATTGRGFSNTTYAVTGCAANPSGLVRLTVSSAHELRAGDLVVTSGVGGVAGANGRFTIAAVPSSTTLDLAASAFSGTYTSGGSVNPTLNHRRGKGFWIYDADMPNFVNCFEFGHDIGWHLDDECHSAQIVNCGLDGIVVDPATIGVQITGLANRNKWYGGFWSSKGRALVVNVQASDQNTIAGVMLPSGSGRSLELQDGGLVLMGCDIYGTVHLFNNADSLQIVGCDLKNAGFTGESAGALQKLQVSSSRMPSSVGINRSIGGQAELAAISAAGAIETRLSARSDGIVAVHRRSSSAGAMLRLHGSGDTAAAAVSVTGTDVYLGGDQTLNPNAAFNFGGAGMTLPMTLRTRRLSTAPAANDRLFNLEVNGNNSSAAEVTFGRIGAVAETVTAGAEAGAIVVETRSGGALTERVRIASNGAMTLAGSLSLTGSMTLAADPVSAMQAATRNYVDNSFTQRAMPMVMLSAATPLTFATHNARMLVANPGSTLSIDWSATGNGFSCMVLNRSGTDLALPLTGFTAAIGNPDGFTKIRSGGVASLIVFSPDGGTTKLCQLTGAGAS
ncbi:glycosyl hydrolase family 28-related protein [Muricoccus aerilatus]|uniref:glycosyl hydrolase family 28-related protein n=1 Tax=Muricoccus aerilatus TaxID=452982 RepID=UPI0005C219EB|nr:glycosyl hydrolase family 28-related protein [Roseomonas aerilata]